MGKVNDQFNYCLSKPERLADFFNVIIYGGKRVILPQRSAEFEIIEAEQRKPDGRYLKSCKQRTSATQIISGIQHLNIETAGQD